LKKQSIPILILLTVAFIAFTFGFFIGRNNTAEPVTLSVPKSMQTLPVETSEDTPSQTIPQPVIVFPINIVLAEKEELMALPGIGEVLAQRILDYRAETGGFSCIEDILNVEGIGQKRFEDIYDLITVGG